MDTAPKKQKTLELLGENEVAIARLYQAYAKRFSRQKDLWDTLAKAEIQHHQWIQQLASGTHGAVQIDEDRFDVEAFRISLDYLEEKLAQAEHGDLSHKEAVAIALDIETGMFERGYFKVFEGDDPELKRVLDLLAKETREHTDSLRDALTRKRWKFF